MLLPMPGMVCSSFRMGFFSSIALSFLFYAKVVIAFYEFLVVFFHAGDEVRDSFVGIICEDDGVNVAGFVDTVEFGLFFRGVMERFAWLQTFEEVIYLLIFCVG